MSQESQNESKIRLLRSTSIPEREKREEKREKSREGREEKKKSLSGALRSPSGAPSKRNPLVWSLVLTESSAYLLVFFVFFSLLTPN